MSYIPTLNISIIHIPKTAGTSVHKKLIEDSRIQFNIGHSMISEIIDGKIPTNFNWPDNYSQLIMNSTKLSIVRHPYDRIKSYFHYIKKYESKLWGDIVKDLTFDDFLYNTPTELSIQVALSSQTDFLYYNGKLMIDKVLYFDSFETELQDVFGEKGYNFKLGTHELKTDSSKFELSVEQKEFIYEKYKDDFINFNFEK